MALTITGKEYHAWADRAVSYGTLAFDSSYAFGGESLTAANLGMNTIDRLEVEGKDGYNFEFDSTNSKLKVFAPAPPIVVDEVHTIASNSITLDYPVAYIMNVAVTNQHQLLTDTSATLSSNECKLSAAPSAGARSTLTFHASTSGTAYVTYITQAWHDVWLNRVTTESASVASSVATLANAAIGIESVRGSANSYEYTKSGDAAGGAGEIEVDFTDSSASSGTTLTMHASASTSTLTTSYIKKPASGFLKDRFVEEEDLTMTAGAGTAAFNILMQGLSGQVPDFTSAGERAPHNLQMNIGDALGTAGEFYINYLSDGRAVAAQDTSSDAVAMTYIKGQAYEIPRLRWLEVPNATDLSGLTGVRVTAIGS